MVVLTATTVSGEQCNEINHPQVYLDCRETGLRCETGISTCVRNGIMVKNCLNLVHTTFQHTIQNVLTNCECDVTCSSFNLGISIVLLIVIFVCK